MSEYLKFNEFKCKNKKTKTIVVLSKCSGCILGIIKWYPQWRYYCFFPATDIVTFHSDRCLLEISQFITKLNNIPRGRRC